MSAHDTVGEWVEEKLSHDFAVVRECREVRHVWKRAFGGRFGYARLMFAVEPAGTFSLAIDPSVPGELQQAIRNGVLSILMGHSIRAILGIKVTVSECDVHEIDSSYMAFFKVANEATMLALGIDGPGEQNITW